MQKIAAWSIAIPLLLLSIGFILVGVVGYALSPERLSAQQIREQARALIPEPVYPSAPKGTAVSKQQSPETRQECIPYPAIVGLRLVTNKACFTVPVPPTPEVVGPSTDETKAWQEKVASIRANHDRAVAQQTDVIAGRQRSDLLSFVKDMIQISVGVLGLITGIAALLIGAMRGNIRPVRQGNAVSDESMNDSSTRLPSTC
jgi:hypothetical protein